jgi:hypothetical protein
MTYVSAAQPWKAMLSQIVDAILSGEKQIVCYPETDKQREALLKIGFKP